MANITLMGASYSDVPAVTLPKTGGGTVTFYENGGGDASNYVTGEFTTQRSAGVMSITLPYTGTGHPVACMVFVKGGAYNNAVSPWYSSTQRYAVGQWTMHKAHQDTAPNYASSSGSNNYGVTTWIYKNSTSSSTSYSRSSAMNTNSFSASNASNSGALCCRFRSNTNLTVYVNTSSYGLLPNQDYVYHVIYSE